MSALDTSTLPLCRLHDYHYRRSAERLWKRGREDYSYRNDMSSSGLSPVPMIVVAKFVSPARMPLWMVPALPKKIVNLRAFLPGSEAQISSLISDVRVRTSGGEPGLASLTIMIDKSNRSIPATSVQARETYPDIANLIAQAVAAPAARPVGTLLCRGELQQMNFPWPALLNDEAHAATAARRPRARPSRILTEFGEDERSRGVEVVCRELGITLATTPRTLLANAIVERALLTIRKEFVDKLPGQSRRGGRGGRGGDEKDLILLEDLAILFDRWVVQIWPHVRGDY
ncbi:hypothetical protein AB4Y72_14860 [Arthrobacter sp. YAF34]|uniref:hypothetical protein n=1 Tax=Arthrobacter sp. YAF34 TaxID=3233083 RepID=UPI003F909330